MLALSSEKWRWRQLSASKSQSQPLSTYNGVGNQLLLVSLWQVLDILSATVPPQEVWGWSAYISNIGTVRLRFFYRFHTWYEPNTCWSFLWCYYFVFIIQTDKTVQSMNWCDPLVDILLPIVLFLKLYCCSVAVFLSTTLLLIIKTWNCSEYHLG